ncbi:MAG: sigma-70 family RNA polymerase sigma factor [Enterocloster asparagiformis]|nr:sigma-70 family RNA polymerase sigma factor [Enterocloster asparagiformis]
MRRDLYDSVTAYIIENQEKFYRLAFSYVKNKDDALDIVQNAVCKALDHYESLRNEAAVKTWFYRILVNESIFFMKKQRREVLSGEDLNVDVPYYEKGYEAEDDLEGQIDRLDEDVQKIIRLRFFEELSLKEISQVMELNLNTVKAKLYRGLKLLKQNVQEVEG